MHVRVIDFYSVKPVDAATLRTALIETGLLVTVEDHWPEGGIGDAVLDALAVGRRHRGARREARAAGDAGVGLAGGAPGLGRDQRGADRRARARRARPALGRSRRPRRGRCGDARRSRRRSRAWRSRSPAPACIRARRGTATLPRSRCPPPASSCPCPRPSSMKAVTIEAACGSLSTFITNVRSIFRTSTGASRRRDEVRVAGAEVVDRDAQAAACAGPTAPAGRGRGPSSPTTRSSRRRCGVGSTIRPRSSTGSAAKVRLPELPGRQVEPDLQVEAVLPPDLDPACRPR